LPPPHYLASDYLSHVAAAVKRDAGTEAETRLIKGDASGGILQAVRQHRPTLVVMTTHGRSGLGRWLFGSTTDEVLRHANVPVLVVPPSVRLSKRGETSHTPRMPRR
jgi:nucleotide-binding universal stress UspA family protein